MANKTDRIALKGFFAPGSVPLGGHFAELIDAALNQQDDGIEKESTGPLKIQAPLPDKDNPSPGKAVILIFNDFTDANPKWKITLGDTNAQGLSIGDASNVRFFIQEGTGNIGIGTTSPGATLEIQGILKLGGIGDLETKIGVLDTELTNLGPKVTTLETTVGDLGPKVTTLETTVGDLGPKVTTLETTVGDLGPKVTTLETTVGDLGPKVTTLETTVGDLGPKVTTLETTVGDHTNQIATLTQQISDLQTTISQMNATP